MAFTTGNDTNILQSTDSSTMGAGEGNDTYIISGNFIDANQEIRIDDVQGTNTIQLVGGLSIVSSSVTSTAAQLTLSNGAVITLVGADTFSYVVGGDSLTGTGGTTEDYSTFVTNTLGLASVPTDSTPVAGGSVEIGDENSGGTGETFTLTTTQGEVVNGTSGNDTYDASTSGSINGDTITDVSVSDNDVLNATVKGQGVTASVTNVETINLDFQFGSSFDADDIAGASTMNLSSSTSGVTAATLTNVSDAYQITTDGTIESLNVDKDTNLKLSGNTLALDNTSTVADITVESTGSANTLNLAATADFADIEVNGDADLTIKNVGTTDDIKNNLTGNAQLTINIAADANFDGTNAEADLFQITKAYSANTATFVDGANVQLDKTSNDITLKSEEDKTDRTESINVTATADGNIGFIRTSNAGDFEAVNFTAAGNTQTVEFAALAAGNNQFNIDGTGDLTLSLGTTTSQSIDASGLTGSLTINDIDEAAGSGGGVLGGSGNDSFKLGAAVTADLDILGGAGNDTITLNNDVDSSTAAVVAAGGEGDDTITLTGATAAMGGSTLTIQGDAGADSLTVNGVVGTGTAGTVAVDGGADADTLLLGTSLNMSAAAILSVKGGAGDDTMILATGSAGVLAGSVTFDGGDGTDTLTLAAATTTVSATASVKFADLEEVILDAKAGTSSSSNKTLIFNSDGVISGDLNLVGKNDSDTNSIVVRILEGTDLAVDLTNVNITTSGLDALQILGSAATAASIKGSEAGEQIISFAASAGSIKGNGGDDIIVVDTADVDATFKLTGGEGNDIFRLTNTIAATDTNAATVDAGTQTAGYVTVAAAASSTAADIQIQDFEDGSDLIDLSSLITATFTSLGAGTAVNGQLEVVEKTSITTASAVADNELWFATSYNSLTNLTTLNVVFDANSDAATTADQAVQIDLVGDHTDLALADFVLL
jgi:hypothetical protein